MSPPEPDFSCPGPGGGSRYPLGSPGTMNGHIRSLGSYALGQNIILLWNIYTLAAVANTFIFLRWRCWPRKKLLQFLTGVAALSFLMFPWCCNPKKGPGKFVGVHWWIEVVGFVVGFTSLVFVSGARVGMCFRHTVPELFWPCLHPSTQPPIQTPNHQILCST